MVIILFIATLRSRPIDPVDVMICIIFNQANMRSTADEDGVLCDTVLSSKN